jgi:hypothetical protein
VIFAFTGVVAPSNILDEYLMEMADPKYMQFADAFAVFICELVIIEPLAILNPCPPELSQSLTTTQFLNIPVYPPETATFEDDSI